MKRKAAHRKVVRKKSFLSELLERKNRPLHGMALGTVLVLLKSVLGVLALVGTVVFAVSLIAFLSTYLKKSK